MKKIITLALCLSAALATLFLAGCNGGALAPGGAYSPGITTYVTNADNTVVTNFTATGAPDFAFYQVDSSFALAYATLDAAFTVEYQNRAFLWSISPDIKHSLDSIRPEAWQLARDYAAGRAAYEANPIPANLNTLQTLLAQVQSLSVAAQAAIAVNTNVAPSVTSTNTVTK